MKNLFPSLPENATLATVFGMFPETIAPLLEFHDRLLRADGPLDPADRELIAAYVSGLNACAFCHGAHTAMARAFGIDPNVVDALMADPDTAPVKDALRPLLRYAKTLTLTPTRLVEGDADAVYAAGWNEAALYQTVQITALFNMMNRILEGTGITEYYADPRDIGEARLSELRSITCYGDFGRSLGLPD